MKEIKAIVAAYDRIEKTLVRAALATVVRVDGSSYRREGARMLVMDNGIWVGGISGGCLEGDALKRARLSIAKAAPSVVTYDTSEEDAYQVGAGLGCNGIIDVLFTPLDFHNTNNAVEVLRSCTLANRQTHILVTITHAAGDWSFVKTGETFLYKDPASLKVFEDNVLTALLQETIDEQNKNNKSAIRHFELEGEKKLTVFIEIMPPEIHLVLMGHQYDAYPLARLAKEIGWRVTMITNPLKVNPHFSKSLDEILDTEHLTKINLDNYTAVLLISHDFKTDKTNLAKILNLGAGYIGMLGPRIRAEKIFRELIEEGITINGEIMERIYAPAGLDIGALSPEEIALSLTAEIRTVFSERAGGFLKLRQSTIHERT
jgi:xanthine dehydrogenase accessory factor